MALPSPVSDSGEKLSELTQLSSCKQAPNSLQSTDTSMNLPASLHCPLSLASPSKTTWVLGFVVVNDAVTKSSSEEIGFVYGLIGLSQWLSSALFLGPWQGRSITEEVHGKGKLLTSKKLVGREKGEGEGEGEGKGEREGEGEGEGERENRGPSLQLDPTLIAPSLNSVY